MSPVPGATKGLVPGHAITDVILHKSLNDIRVGLPAVRALSRRLHVSACDAERRALLVELASTCVAWADALPREGSA